MEQFQVLFQQLLQNISHYRGTRFPLRNTALSAEHGTPAEHVSDARFPLRNTCPFAVHVFISVIHVPFVFLVFFAVFRNFS